MFGKQSNGNFMKKFTKGVGVQPDLMSQVLKLKCAISKIVTVTVGGSL